VVAAAWIIVGLVEMRMWGRRGSRRQVDDRPPEPDPEPVMTRPEPVKAPEPELEPERAAEPEVAYLPVNHEPREWNLWELERVARESVTDDVAKNEERAYLLIYLREFAGPDGTLPADFDGLVRDAFGDLLRAVAL
jgi:hypothetical protein